MTYDAARRSREISQSCQIWCSSVKDISYQWETLPFLVPFSSPKMYLFLSLGQPTSWQACSTPEEVGRWRAERNIKWEGFISPQLAPARKTSSTGSSAPNCASLCLLWDPWGFCCNYEHKKDALAESTRAILRSHRRRWTAALGLVVQQDQEQGMLSEAKMVIRVFLAAAAASSGDEGGDLAANETPLLIHHCGTSPGSV